MEIIESNELHWKYMKSIEHLKKTDENRPLTWQRLRNLKGE